ncbi:hypothetical protein KJQ97_00130 [Campylobacter sp. 2018MI01]|uniref:sulfatase-like hydrolase/transferase n=1 Tax=Campylobacter sp. 2018MI01 TaxID=2836735 RepID=UPI001BDB1EBD|nr:sulfatase-like hydrolase/transferase [Campylobacter sp. 2018MI01]MBT0877836.1 hypothetical protein [Campylobacter sp. 2018MI01]
MFYKTTCVYFVFLSLCLAFRLIFLAIYNEFSLSVFYIGLRFDMAWCGVLATLYLIASFSRCFLVRIYYDIACFLLLVSELVFMIFFKIYRKNIDDVILLLFVEEPLKLFKTAIKSSYGIVPAFIIFIILFIILIKIHEKILKNNKKYFAIPLGIILIFSLNYQQFYSPIEQVKFKNNILQTSAYGHIQGLINYIKIKTYKNTFKSFNVGEPRDTACEVLKACDKEIDLYKYLEHTKEDELQIKPKKIYYIIHESLSDWVFETRFAELFSDLHDFIKKDNVAYIKALHNAENTRESFWIQILNTYYDNYLDFEPNIQSYKIKTNIVDNFKALGFHTNFFKGTEYNWSGSVYLFDLLGANTYDENNIKASKDFRNAWGFDDDVVFDFLDTKADEKSLNIMITVSNHPPFDLNFLKHSDIKIPFDKIEKLSKKYKSELATLYWSQKIMIDWVKNTAKKEPNSLFIITGDHYGRYNIDDSDDLATTHTIPVIMYYPQAKIYPTCKITNQLDIMPSIINLIAPKDFRYYSFGNACFSLKKEEIKDELKIGKDIAYKNNSFMALSNLETKLRALSWYLIYNGNIIK